MTRALNPGIGLTVLFLLAASCEESNPGREPSSSTGTESATAAASSTSSEPVSAGANEGSTRKPPPAAGRAPSEFAGTVMETMNSGGYTYLRVDTGSETIWAAANQFEVAVGEKVVVPAGMPMTNFRSNTLNREFALIYFTGGVQKVEAGDATSLSAGSLSAGHPPLPGGHPALPGGGASPLTTGLHTRARVDIAAQIKPGSIEKPSGGLTVAEVFDGRAQQAGKRVVVRGKVVKFTGGIMKRNWLHLQDGTGAAGSNDLTVTTTDSAAVGDTVVIEGTVVLDKDFGMGYEYPVLVEEASVTVEASAK